MSGEKPMKKLKGSELGKYLNERAHRKYDYKGRVNYLLLTTFRFLVSIIVFAILYSNASRLNEIKIIFLRFGGILLVITLFFLIKYGIYFFKEIWNLIKRQKHWMLYLLALILLIFLLFAYSTKETALEPALEPAFDFFENFDFVSLSPVELDQFNGTLSSNQNKIPTPYKPNTISNNPSNLNFNIANQDTLPKTIFLLALIWGAYYFTRRKYRFLRRNKKILLMILFSISLILISNHILLSSSIAELFDWALFLAVSATSIFGALLGIRWVNSWNMANDMTIWGLRLFGILLVFVGFMVLTAGALTSALMGLAYGTNLVSAWSPWIIGLSLMFWGAFCEFRSSRRHHIVGIWQA